MAYRRISPRPTESLERVLEETLYGGVMKTGLHSAKITTIVIIDTAADITFTNDFGETITQRFFFQNFERTDLSYLFKQLVSSAVDSPQDLWSIHDHPDEVKLLVGKRIRLDVGSNGGLPLVKTREGFGAGPYTAGTLLELREALAADHQKLQRNEIKGVFRDDSAQGSKDSSPSRSGSGKPNPGRSGPLPARPQF